MQDSLVYKEKRMEADLELRRDQADAVENKLPVLLQYWTTVLRWKWMIGAIIALCLAVGIIITLLATPLYTATSRVEISRDQKNITNVEGVESAQAGRDLEFYQTQYALLEARSLAQRVARELKLVRNVDFFEAHGVKPEKSQIFSDTSSKPLTAQQTIDRNELAVQILLSNVAITPVRGSSLVDISYTSGSAELSAKVTNAWAQQFIETSIDRKFASTADARKFLEERLSELRSRLESSERDLVNYARAKGIVNLGSIESADGKTRGERTLAANDLENLNMALASATADRIAAESKAGTTVRGSNRSLLENQTISSLRQRRAEISAEYAKMMVRFEPSYPAALALQRQIEVLDSNIQREESRVRNTLSSEYQEALQRENSLKQRVEQLKTQYGQQKNDSIQYNIYQREADTNRELYDGLLQRYKEIGVAGVGANNIAIVDVAKIPENPSSPNLMVNVILALLAGTVLAGLATVALEQIDEGLREPGQVNRLLQIPLLGSVPDIEKDDAILQLLDAKSEISESYLTVRSNLAFSTDHGVPRSMMVTSTRSGEGKSTSSFALAAVMSRTGSKVILIDADMRSPSIHQFFNVGNKTGLSNFLAGENNWQSMIVASSIAGISVLPAGPKPPSAGELLSSDRMTVLVQQLLEHFDHVVIDSPPILGLADAPLLARTVEATVVVIESKGVPLRGVKASINRLNSVQAQIIGGILTKLDQRATGYGYGYGYGYGKDENEKE